MANKLASGLNPVIIKKEETFGVMPLDFVDHDGTDKGLPINQSLESPINVTDTYNKEVIRSTFGSQIQKEGVLRLGQRNVSSSFGHALGLNDFVVIGNMFFQNGYEFTASLASTSFVSISGTTIEVADVEELKDGYIVIISGRADSTEDGEYVISNVDTDNNTFDITTSLEDTDLTGAIVGKLGIHTSLIEDVNNCGAQELNNSYTMYIPEKFPDTDGICGTSQGEMVNGVVPTTLSVDFVDASYTCDVIAKQLNDCGESSPRVDLDYKLPSADGYQRQNYATLQKWDSTNSVWVELETMALDITITLGTEDSMKVRKAGELSRAVVDGVEISGNYNALLLTEDEATNISHGLYESRDQVQGGGLYRLAIVNTTGEAIYITGNIKFYGEAITRELGGFMFSTEFQFLRSDDHPNVELTVINNYNESLETYL